MRSSQATWPAFIQNALSSKLALYSLLFFILLALYGLKDLKLSADYRVYFDSHSSLSQLESEVNQKYNLGNNLILVVDSELSFFEESPWEAIENLSSKIGVLSKVKKVRNYQIIAETTQSQPLFLEEEDIEWNGKNSRQERATRFFNHPRARQVLTADEKTTLIDIHIDSKEEQTAQSILAINHSISALATEFEQAYPFINKVRFGGVMALNQEYIEVVRHDLAYFIPGLLLIFTLGLFYFYRKISVVFIILTCGLTSVLTAFGIAGWFEFKLAAINAFSPVIIISISVATSAHIFTVFFRNLGDVKDTHKAITQSIDSNFIAILMSNLTTAGGFLLLLFSPSPPIKVVGIVVAIGTVTSYLFSQIITPIWTKSALKNCPAEQIKKINNSSNFKNLQKMIFGNKKSVVTAAGLFMLLSVFGLNQMQVNDNVYSYFPQHNEFSQSTNKIRNEFGGVARVLFTIDSGEKLGVFSTEYLTNIRRFKKWLANQENVVHINDIDSLFESSPLPVSKLKELASTSEDFRERINTEVTDNFNESKVEVVLSTTDTQALLFFSGMAQNWLSKNAAGFQVSKAVSTDLMFAELGKRNSESLFYSLLLALIVVACLIGYLYRSLKVTLIALACNILPLTTVYGLWFISGGYLSLGTSIMMGMIMGILVDDTIHMLIKFRDNLHLTSQRAIKLLFRLVVPAITITSLTLVAGLSIGLLSSFRPIIELSGLSAVTIFLALFLNVTLMPIALKKYFSTQGG